MKNCPRCNIAYDESKKFCKVCGNILIATAASVPLESPNSHGPESRRRGFKTVYIFLSVLIIGAIIATLFILKTSRRPNVFRGSLTDKGEIVLQPGVEGVDVFITNVYLNGGQDDYRLRVGGWGDYYYSLIKFNIQELPSKVISAKIHLYSFDDGHSNRTPMFID